MPRSSNSLFVVAVGLVVLFSGLAGAGALLEQPTHDSSSDARLQATTTGTAASPSPTTQPPTATATSTSSPTSAPTATSTQDTAAETATSAVESSGTLPNLLVIVGSEGETSYELAVDGDLQKSDEQGATVDPEDSVDGSSATGAVAGNGADAYRFSGSITDITLDGDATLYLNGERYEPYPNRLVIVGSEDVANYEFAVDGKLRKSSTEGASIDDEDTVAGNRATGSVAGNGADAYRYSGEITTFSLDGDATVYRNGEEIDPADDPTPSPTPEPDGGAWDAEYGSVETFDSVERTGPIEYVEFESCEQVTVYGTNRYNTVAIRLSTGQKEWIEMGDSTAGRYTPDSGHIVGLSVWEEHPDEIVAGFEPELDIEPPCGDS